MAVSATSHLAEIDFWAVTASPGKFEKMRFVFSPLQIAVSYGTTKKSLSRFGRIEAFNQKLWEVLLAP